MMQQKLFFLAVCVAYARAQCANSPLIVQIPSGGNAYIESPNYGFGDYPNNANCEWIIISPKSVKRGIEISSVTFSLQGGYNEIGCGYDHLFIDQMHPNGTEHQVATFCDPVCDVGSRLCPDSDSVCIWPDQWCDGVAHCPNGADEGAFCSSDCGAPNIPPKEDRNTRSFRNAIAESADHSSSKTHRIVGGEEATPHSLPWQVAMLNYGSYHICGASIISPQWVLTSGRCCTMYMAAPRSYKVVVGAHVLGATNEPHVKTYELLKLIKHPRFNHREMSNDFCLLKIDGTFEYGPHVGAICLADDSDCRANTSALISGWGSTKPVSGGRSVKKNFDDHVEHVKDSEVGFSAEQNEPNYDTPRNNNLKQAYVDITTQEYCSAHWSGSITPDLMCATRTGKDTCEYDAGGPLAQKTVEGKWKLCAVISMGYACADARYPRVYGRVSHVKDWIMQTIRPPN